MEMLIVKDWIRRQAKKYAHVVFIAGNHDINFHRNIYDNFPDNVHHLQDSMETVEGINFYGSPYTPRFGNWGFGEPEEQLITRFSHIRKDTDVLITHGPAYSILDKNHHGECCGSKALYQRIKQLKHLKYHVFGHIHESYGIEQIENVKFCNVSILDEHYKIKNKPTIIEI